jgi:two-component system CheB/CheR fusion protein
MEAGGLAGLTVLVIEDHPDLRDLLRMWLERGGAVVHEACNGTDAILVLATTRPPDVIISDLHMPGMDGCAFVTHLRQDAGHGHIPVIALTGSATDRALISTLEAGFDAHLVKPVTDEALHAQIHRVLGR